MAVAAIRSLIAIFLQDRLTKIKNSNISHRHSKWWCWREARILFGSSCLTQMLEGWHVYLAQRPSLYCVIAIHAERNGIGRAAAAALVGTKTLRRASMAMFHVHLPLVKKQEKRRICDSINSANLHFTHTHECVFYVFEARFVLLKQRSGHECQPRTDLRKYNGLNGERK